MWKNNDNFKGKNNTGFNKGYNNKTSENKKIEFEFTTKGFYNEKGLIREELITKEAEKIAKLFADTENNGRDKLSNSQLRAFFNEVKGLNNRINSNEDNWDSVYPMVLMIKSKIEYRAIKDEKKMKALKEFLLNGIDCVQKANKENQGCKTFKDFVMLFEAVVGYSYGQGIVK